MRFYKIASERERLYQELIRLGVDNYALRMSDKGETLNIVIADLKPVQANVIKQEALASGMDAAIKRGAVSCTVDKTDVMIMGSINHYPRLIARLKTQKAITKDTYKILELATDIKTPDHFLTRGDKVSINSPLVMGIINCTPDSFSDGGLLDDSAMQKKVEDMVTAGVDILDIGGASSRPDADDIDSDVEIKRISFALKTATKNKKSLISIDTNNYITAKYAITHGAKIINDINGLSDDNMIRLVADSKVACIIMHKKGSSKEMQNLTDYDDLFMDIKKYFYERIERAIKFGVNTSNIILDIGFGFSKTYEQNFQLLKYLSEFKSFGLPILVGMSNKSMIGISTGKEIKDRLIGTVAGNSIAIINGANIIRVHDIGAGIDTVKVADAVLKS